MPHFDKATRNNLAFARVAGGNNARIVHTGPSADYLQTTPVLYAVSLELTGNIFFLLSRAKWETEPRSRERRGCDSPGVGEPSSHFVLLLTNGWRRLSRFLLQWHKSLIRFKENVMSMKWKQFSSSWQPFQHAQTSRLLPRDPRELVFVFIQSWPPDLRPSPWHACPLCPWFSHADLFQLEQNSLHLSKWIKTRDITVKVSTVVCRKTLCQLLGLLWTFSPAFGLFSLHCCVGNQGLLRFHQLRHTCIHIYIYLNL